MSIFDVKSMADVQGVREMVSEREILIDCSTFEESISDYLERTLSNSAHKAVAEHALKCPLCHTLLNEVKESLAACRELAAIESPLTLLEARILSKTMPETSMQCEEFESHLTDYLDGFLPAQLFHRWERHAVLCDDCTDLPGTVVRSLAALVTYKLDELPIPAGLNERILQSTLGSEIAVGANDPLMGRIMDWIREIRFPISVPQLAPVAMMLMFAFLFISQTVSADGTLSDVYSKSIQIAEQTYRQSSEAFSGTSDGQPRTAEPANGTTFVEGDRR